MKALYIIFTTFFTSSFLSYAYDFSGTYYGKKSNWLTWGEECVINIKQVNNNYEITLVQEKQKSIFPRILKSKLIDKATLENSTTKINFSEGTRWSEGLPRQDTTIHFNQGQLTQIKFSEAYLIFPATTYTCGKLQKQENI